MCLLFHHAVYVYVVSNFRFIGMSSPHQKQLVDELSLSAGDEIDVIKKWVIDICNIPSLHLMIASYDSHSLNGTSLFLKSPIPTRSRTRRTTVTGAGLKSALEKKEFSPEIT